MTALWQNDGTGWRLMAPVGFSAEQALHNLIAEAPHLLPLAGSPQLVVVGREVQLGSGYADLLAIEPSGRLVIIEVKLAKNSEARRAVVAQVLAYAAYLHGVTQETLERDILGTKLRERGHATLAEAVAAMDQEGAFDPGQFTAGLSAGLAAGRFRLVLVLDQVPPELVRLVGYLEAIADKLLIDLVTVSAYDVQGAQVLVPQRVDPERYTSESSEPAVKAKEHGYLASGANDFAESIENAAPEERPKLRRLYDWAVSLERKGLVTLSTYHGTTGRKTLLPRLRDEGVGLVTIWNEKGGYLQLWRSVFERRAPKTLPRIEELLAPVKVGQGNTTREVSDELLAMLRDGYFEAAEPQRLPPASRSP